MEEHQEGEVFTRLNPYSGKSAVYRRVRLREKGHPLLGQLVDHLVGGYTRNGTYISYEGMGASGPLSNLGPK